VGALNLDVFFRCQIEAGFPTLSSSAVAPHDRRSEVRNEIRGKSFVCCGQWTGISCGCINLVLMVASCLLISHRSLLLVLPLGLLDKASRTAPDSLACGGNGGLQIIRRISQSQLTDASARTADGCGV
jgi:hypothetical protein